MTLPYDVILQDRLIILMLALLLSPLLGPRLRRITGLKALARRLRQHCLAIERKLNRTSRSTASRVYRGIIVLAYICLCGLVFSLLILYHSQLHNNAMFLTIFSVALLLPSHRLISEPRRLRQLLAQKQLAKARAYIASTTHLHTYNADAHNLRRYQNNHLARTLVLNIITPSLYYLLFGLGGLALTQLIAMLARLYGHSDRQMLAFGWASLALHRLIQAIPARCAALWIIIASLFTAGGNPLGALKGIYRSGRHQAQSDACALAAISGALSIALGGPEPVTTDYKEPLAWFGTGTAQLTPEHAKRIQLLLQITLLLWTLTIISAFGLHHYLAH